MRITSELIPISSEIIGINSLFDFSVRKHEKTGSFLPPQKWPFLAFLGQNSFPIYGNNFGSYAYFFRNLSFDKKEILTYFYKRKYNSNELLISSPRAYVHTRKENFSFLGFADFLRCRREKKKKLREKEKEPCRSMTLEPYSRSRANSHLKPLPFWCS